MCRRLDLPIWCCLVAGLIAGCGPAAPVRKLADVSGKVSYQGKPLTMGSVLFQPKSGPLAEGLIQSDGTYKLKGEIGPNTVTIVSRDPEAPGADPGKRTPTKSHIPEVYASPQGGLNFDVKAGSNTADFDLK